MDINNMLDDLLQGVREAHSQLVDQELEMREQLSGVVSEKRRLESVIKAAQGSQPKQEEEEAPRKERQTYISEEMLSNVVSAIKGLTPEHEALPGVKGTFTARDVAETGVASAFTVHNALKALRDQGEVRLAGTIPAPGQPKAYALVGDGDGS